LTLFLLVPGLLLLQQENARSTTTGVEAAKRVLTPGLWWGYLWLLAGSGYFLVRCLLDLAVVRRPALEPNLNRSGLAWLIVALFVCLAGVAVRKPADHDALVGKGSTVLEETQKRAAEIVAQTAGEPIDGSGTLFWVKQALSGACHLTVIVVLILVGVWHFQDLSAGLAAALLYLLVPYTAYHVTQLHHVWPTALLLCAIFAYRRPALAGGFLGVAAGTLFFPALTLPVWLSFYGRRNRLRFVAGFVIMAGACLGLAAWFLWLDRQLVANVQQTLGWPDWIPWRAPESESFWLGFHWAYRIPVFLVYVVFVVGTGWWPNPKNLAHLIALCAAILIGVQFWYADRGGVYVLWYLPLLLMLMFRPNLSERFAPPDLEEPGRIERAIRRVFEMGTGFLRRWRSPSDAKV
jgi:hypothetical protein